MTAIEFYDRTPIENAISSLTTAPKKIIYIGDGDTPNVFLKKMKIFIKQRHLDTVIDYRSVNRDTLGSIVKELSDIVEQEDDCVFDLTGGDDLTLVAMGIVYEKYPQKNIKMQRFNIEDGQVTDCDNDGCVIYNGMPKISVGENILLHGGAVRFSDDHKKGTYKWNYTPEFLKDIGIMWSLCAADPGFWNARINTLEMAEKYFGSKDSLTVSFTATALKQRLSKKGPKYTSPKYLLAALSNKNLVSFSVMNDEEFIITYKNKQIKRCLTTAGTILEQKIAVTAKSVMDEENNLFYNDVLSGVHIDWDGRLHQEKSKKKDIKNEIDIIAMRGITPVFISCKNGQVYDDELYKLETVATRFGGVYAKKVLIATYLGKEADSLAYFEQRAKDMGIELICGVNKITDDDKFRELIKGLIG